MNEIYFLKFSRAIRLGSVWGIRFASGNELFWQLLLYSRSVVSDSLPLHGLQHTRLPCLSPSLGACSKSRPLSHWCHPTTTYSVIPFSSCLLFFPASGSFPMIWLFTSGGQSTEASASPSVLPKNIHGWFSLGLTCLISTQSKGLSRLFSNTTTESINSSALSLIYGPTLTINIWLLERP